MLCVSARLVALLGRRRQLLQCIGCIAAQCSEEEARQIHRAAYAN
jgi:hypothetical protein